MAIEHQQVLADYNMGRRSVEDVVHVCRSYRGPFRHLLWDKAPGMNSNCLLTHCLDLWSEPKMFELLEALIADNPGFPLLQDEDRGTFLDVALSGTWRGPRPVAWSRRVLFLLAVPGTTQSAPNNKFHALHRACCARGIDPAVVHRLIDLDPDVLAVPTTNLGDIPLHHALRRNPTAPFVARMVQMRPESLLARNFEGRTPVEGAIEADGFAGEALAVARASALERLVRFRPESVAVVVVASTFTETGRRLRRRPRRGDAALVPACRRFREHPDLLRAIVQADPTALAVAACPVFPGFPSLLPFEVAANHRQTAGTTPETAAAAITRALVETETLELALAVVEYALVLPGVSEDHDVPRSPREERWAGEARERARFFGHVRRVVTSFLASASRHRGAGCRTPPCSSSFEVAQALRALDDNGDGRHRQMDVCRALFLDDGGYAANDDDAAAAATSHRLFPSLVRDALMGNEAITGLYRLNSRGRLNPSVSHQLSLLESVKEDLDCIFLHLRVAVDLLLPPRRVETIGAVQSSAVVEKAEVRPSSFHPRGA